MYSLEYTIKTLIDFENEAKTMNFVFRSHFGISGLLCHKPIPTVIEMINSLKNATCPLISDGGKPVGYNTKGGYANL